MNVARTLWLAVEPLHAVVYFAPEHRQAQDAVGLRGGWMAYFASRAAPLGSPSAELVTACFYNFAPRMVSRAIPDAWDFAPPEHVLAARYSAMDRALTRILGTAVASSGVPVAAELMARAAGSAFPAGRPMFAANAALEWPDSPHLRLWHAATLLREHRGDGHVAALMTHELDPCEAHLLAAANGHVTEETLFTNRGWTLKEWEVARERLRARGLLDRSGRTLSESGRAMRRSVEDLTDRLAMQAWESLDEVELDRLLRALAPLLERVAESETVPYPNPMGLPSPA